MFLVDRFHFFHHSPTDDYCRDYCSTYDINNVGVVTTHSRVPVDGPGDNPRLVDAIGVNRVRQVMQGDNQVREAQHHFVYPGFRCIYERVGQFSLV